jgi:hypothetical protein
VPDVNAPSEQCLEWRRGGGGEEEEEEEEEEKEVEIKSS